MNIATHMLSMYVKLQFMIIVMKINISNLQTCDQQPKTYDPFFQTVPIFILFLKYSQIFGNDSHKQCK